MGKTKGSIVSQGLECKWSPQVRESKRDLDSGFHAMDSGNLDYGFQSLVGFRIPATRIPDFWEIVNAETRNVFE